MALNRATICQFPVCVLVGKRSGRKNGRTANITKPCMTTNAIKMVQQSHTTPAVAACRLTGIASGPNCATICQSPARVLVGKRSGCKNGRTAKITNTGRYDQKCH